MSQQLTLLLDTNVWLDYYLPWRSGYAAAQRLIVSAFEQNQTLAYAVPSIKDVFYMSAAEYKRAERADLFLEQLVPNATVLCTGVAKADLVVSKEKEFGCLSLEAREVVVIAEAPLRGQYLNFEMVGNVGTVRVNAADGSQSDSVCNFSLAHNEGRGEKAKTIWTNCAYWRPKDRCGVFQYITQGKKLFVSGRPRVSLYRRGDGETGVSLECTVNQLELLSASDKGASGGASFTGAELPDPGPGLPIPPDFSSQDNDLPF